MYKHIFFNVKFMINYYTPLPTKFRIVYMGITLSVQLFPSNCRSVCLSVCLYVDFSHFSTSSSESCSEPISTKLGTKHPWVKGIQVSSNEGPRLFPRGDNYKIAEIP